MSINVRDFKVLSSDGVHRLAGLIYEPDGEVKGYFHVVHGMTDHIHRYAPIMRDMAELGFICFGYDHIGHGYTANDDDELGYIAKKDGWDLLCRDVKVFSDAVKAEYGADVPYVLMGHSMGSFIVRIATEKYVRPDKLIIMGTGGPNPLASVGLSIVAIIKCLRGEKHVSKFVDDVAFGSYNKRFGGNDKNDPKLWLSTDEAQRKKYYADKFCMFKFTVSAMNDLMTLTNTSNRKEWYEKIDNSIPMLLLSGEDDPVGDFGKGVTAVYDGLKQHGVDVKCILYPRGRHEILNDFTYEDVKKDIIGFIM